MKAMSRKSSNIIKKNPIPQAGKAEKTPDVSQSTLWLLFVLFGGLALFFSVSFVFWTVIPFLQMTNYLGKVQEGKIRQIQKTEFIFSPYTYAQRVIRYEYLKYLEDQVTTQRDAPFLNHAVDKMEELVKKEGSNPYEHIRLGRAFDKKADLLKDPSYFKNSEHYYKEAIVLAPQRQEAYYAYALSLVRQNRSEEAVKILKEPPALDPNIPISYFYLGLAQFNLGNATYVESLQNLETFFKTGAQNPDPHVSLGVYQRLFSHFYEQKDAERLLASAARLVSLDAERQPLYQKLVDAITTQKQIPVLEFQGGKISNIL